jgi:hypothetical protein
LRLLTESVVLILNEPSGLRHLSKTVRFDLYKHINVRYLMYHNHGYFKEKKYCKAAELPYFDQVGQSIE